MKKLLFLTSLCLILNSLSAQKMPKKVLLPNGWSLSPAGKSVGLGDLPLNMVVSNNKKWIAISNNGQSNQSIQLFDVQKGNVSDSVDIPKSWYGLAFGKNDQKLYASGGNDNWIMVYQIKLGKLLLSDSILLGGKWPIAISPTGLAIDTVHNKLYTVTKENKKLYTIDLTKNKVTDSVSLPAEAYACVLSKNHKILYISIWGGSAVIAYDVAKQSIITTYKVGSNPNELILNKSNSLLYVANSNDNSVSVIDLKKSEVIETLNAALFPNAPAGSTTNGVALSDDEKTLYIANADNNCLAVFDVSKKGTSVSKGFIPTGWFPTSVRTIGKTIYVANGKGFTSMANPYGPDPYKKRAQLGYQKGIIKKNGNKDGQYIGGLFTGTLSIINTPTEKQLIQFSKRVYENTPYNKEAETSSDATSNSPIPNKLGNSSPIKHVFYIVKENRTYDQILGDMKEGNGDPALCLFGENITPNQHALAKEFVLLDNFYVNGEVSADGHNWTLGGYATDYLEKTWPTDYGGRGGRYDAEGNRAIANNKDGFIWDFAKRAGVSYRTYGEFADNFKPNIPVLAGHYCTYFTSWDQKVRDTTRFNQWRKDFDSLLSKNAVPQLNTLRFINDHTEGLRLGRPSPNAHVADNDLAVGMFVEYLSKSPIWNESVVFIVEDDAQDGPDHVDAHRSIAFVAGGLVKTKFVDHAMYSTSSVLKTISMILGMPPMSQYVAAANTLYKCFQNTPNNITYQAKVLRYDINEKNSKESVWQRMSEKFDFTKEDAISDRLFNEVIWKSSKGLDAMMPAPKRAAFFKNKSKKDEDD
jgi:YVTN family beta-propeller protein